MTTSVYWNKWRVLIAILMVVGIPLSYGLYMQSNVRQSMGRMMCWKNLTQFSHQMSRYAAEEGLKEEAVYSKAGLLIRDTHFNEKHGFYPRDRSRGKECNNWRYSRDGLFASCPLSPKGEACSYSGWPTTNVVLTKGFPLLWETSANHDGKRHVLRYDGKGYGRAQLVEDSDFRWLTNSAWNPAATKR